MERFLGWEALQSFKWEFDGVRPVAMTGGTAAHAIICANLLRILGNRLAGGPCRALGPDMQIRTATTVRYPDGAVTCVPIPADARALPDPVLVIEVSSPSTAIDDRTTKLREYRDIPSVQRYVMIEQDRVFATEIVRTPVGWQHQLTGRGGTLVFAELGVEVSMAELYDGLTFPEPSSDGER